MMTEFERRYSVHAHPGRFGFWPGSTKRIWPVTRRPRPSAGQPWQCGRDISAARGYRYKYGFGLNWEQEIAKNIGMFSRLGWNDGHEEAWTFTDVNWTRHLA